MKKSCLRFHALCGLIFACLILTSFFIVTTVKAAEVMPVTDGIKTTLTNKDPVSLLQYIANHMIAGLRTNKATLKSKPNTVYQLAYQYVVPYADLNEMSKRVLPPKVWNNSTANERDQFQKAFTTTVIRTYASALNNYEDQTIKFLPVRGRTFGKTIEVNGQIISQTRSPINVLYRLVRHNDTWQLYDMSVEGVSMLASFRAQFADILSRGNMHLLLTRLSTHNSR